MNCPPEHDQPEQGREAPEILHPGFVGPGRRVDRHGRGAQAARARARQRPSRERAPRRVIAQHRPCGQHLTHLMRESHGIRRDSRKFPSDGRRGSPQPFQCSGQCACLHRGGSDKAVHSRTGSPALMARSPRAGIWSGCCPRTLALIRRPRLGRAGGSPGVQRCRGDCGGRHCRQEAVS